MILVSALDEELDRIDARYGIDVFWKAFLSTRGGYRVGIPRVPLGELYDGCRKRLPRRAGKFSCAPGCAGFCVVDGRVEGVEREDGSVETADYYLAAVPQDVLPELLPPEVVEREPVFSNLRNLRDVADHRRASLVRPRRDERAVSHAAGQHDAMGVQQDAALRRAARKTADNICNW